MNERRDNRPPEGEIPDILEWKLDVLMAQLAQMGGGTPSEHNPQVGDGGSQPRLPDPKEFDPVEDEFPDRSGIPKILEWKLDVIMKQLGNLNLQVGALNVNVVLNPNFFIWVLVPGLAAIIALLAMIAGILSGILALILFVVVQVVVPFIIKRNQRRAGISP